MKIIENPSPYLQEKKGVSFGYGFDAFGRGLMLKYVE